jgi:UDP-N-acetylglucosamine 2-epimerase
VIHVFIGTKAQYIKTAPVIREMDRRGVPYRLIDSGQHGEFARQLRVDLGVREPDVFLGGSRDVTTIAGAFGWALSLSLLALTRARLRDTVFAGHTHGICVVHGDTPTTFLSGMLAKRAGLDVAHIESGLRSQSVMNPFPEELIRRVVIRGADVLFAPDDVAVANIGSVRTNGAVVPTHGNTSIEAVAHEMASVAVGSSGPAVLTTHRVENLKSRKTMERFVSLLESVASDRPTVFVMHPPTELALEGFDLMSRVQGSDADVVGLTRYPEFVAMIAHAPFVVSDGGSIQEECALIGVPTLLWRRHTERPDGLGRNVVLSEFDEAIIDEFLGSYETLRQPPRTLDASPSEEIVDVLQGWA